MNKFFRFGLIMIAFIAVPLLLTACGESTTTASCGFIVGNGTNGNDAKLHKIIYPGQTVSKNDSTETVTYVPCNSRNYIINDGSVKNANGDQVGDRHQLIMATTNSGVPIIIAARALWTLNESDEALRAFYNVCFKYQCASANDQSGNANFSTPGWNGMLAENFGPAMDTSARIAAIQVDDSIWKQHDPQLYKALGDGMSAVYADVMRANLGYSVDLFCGSGNSAWKDPNKPGEGEFTCTPVRIVVDDVQRGQLQADDSTQGVLAINQQRLQNAQALYGPDAGYWLALQDSIDKCKNAGTSCIFNVGGTSGGATVAIPANSPTPVPPTATPVKK